MLPINLNQFGDSLLMLNLMSLQAASVKDCGNHFDRLKHHITMEFSFFQYPKKFLYFIRSKNLTIE